MLTGLESILRLLLGVIFMLAGGLPLGVIPSDDGAVERFVSEHVSSRVRFAIVDPAIVNEDDAGDVAGFRQIENSDTDSTSDDEPQQVTLEAPGGDDEALDDLIDEESLDDVVADIENLDDALLDPETLDNLYPMLVIPGADVGDPETLDLDSFNVLPGAALPSTTGDGVGSQGGDNAAPSADGATRNRSQRDTSQAGGGEDRNCPDFSSQEEAQDYFDQAGGSETNNVDGLDQDGDGIACENEDYGQASDGGGGGRNDDEPAGSGNTGGGNGGSRENDRGNGGADESSGSGNSGATDDSGNRSNAENENDVATANRDLPDCRTVAVSGDSVAATGCGDGGSTVRPSPDTISRETSRQETSRSSDDVRTSTDIERSADGGTEIEIDRGGDNQRSGSGSEPRTNERPTERQERASESQPTRDEAEQGADNADREAAEQKKSTAVRDDCRTKQRSDERAAASEGDDHQNVLVDNDIVRVTMSKAGLATEVKASASGVDDAESAVNKQQQRACDDDNDDRWDGDKRSPGQQSQRQRQSEQ